MYQRPILNREAETLLKELLSRIKKIPLPQEDFQKGAKAHWDQIAKPLDGLGKLEDMLSRICGIQGILVPKIQKKGILVFCGDNGIVEEGVSQTGQEVTLAVVKSIAGGTSPVALMAKGAGAKVIPIDMGIKTKEPSLYSQGVWNKRLMPGTKNFLKMPAMSMETVLQGILTGMDTVKTCQEEGYEILATGEMGIGNTTTSTALCCSLLDLDPREAAGPGAGLDSRGLERKKEVIAAALHRYGLLGRNFRKALEDGAERPLALLYALGCVGGLDLAGLTGAFLGGALWQIPMVLDGIISQTAGFMASLFSPRSLFYMLPSHQGREPLAVVLHEAMGLSPILQGDFSLGEGTGACMLFPLLDMALAVYQNNTSFDQIHIREYERL